MATITYYAWYDTANEVVKGYTLSPTPSSGDDFYNLELVVFNHISSYSSSRGGLVLVSMNYYPRYASGDITVSDEPDNIADAIAAAQGRVADCYTAISNKGGTLPATQNLANMPTAISSIPSGSTPVINSLNVTPTTSAQTITAPSGVDGYNPVNVSAVTSSIDSNIKAGNIKSGVSILGVSGSVVQLNGETRTVSITSTSGNTFTPSSGKNGITSITVTPTNQAKTITPTTSQQTISVPSGYSGFGTLTVNAVTSSIDANITAGNIKKDVQILGVTGTYEGGGGTTPRFLKCTLTSSDFEVDDYGDLDPSEVDDFVSTLVINVILDLETATYGRILWLPDLQSISEEIYSNLLDVFEYECYCNSYTDSAGTSNILVGYEMLDSAFTLYSTIDGVYFFKNTSVPYLAEGTVLSIRSGTMVDQDGYSFSPFGIRLTANKFFTPAT